MTYRIQRLHPALYDRDVYKIDMYTAVPPNRPASNRFMMKLVSNFNQCYKRNGIKPLSILKCLI